MKKVTLGIVCGFLIHLVLGCSFIKQVGLDDTRERIQGLEAANRALSTDVLILEDRVRQLEQQCIVPEDPPEEINKSMTIPDRIRAVCKEEGFRNCNNLIKLARCESSLNPYAKNIRTRREKSYGLYQINRLAHPHVSIKQAQDVEWSTRWAIREIRKNGYSAWKVCRRKMRLPR